MFGASKTNSASTGGPADPYFYDVTMLLTGNGTNGAQNNTFLDSSSNAFSITRNGNTTQGSFSPYGSLWSNYLSGTTGNYLSVPYNTNYCNFGTGDFTVECWANISYVQYSAILSSMSNGITSAMWLLGFSNTAHQMTFGMDSGGNAICGADYTAYENTWTHIAACRSGSTLKLFFNGTQVASVTNTTNFTGDSSNAFRIGTRYTNETAYNLAGYVSNVRIVKGTALYTSSFTPSTTPLTAVSGTNLLTCQSNRFIDNSSNAYTITVGGTPSVQRFSPFNPTVPYSTATIGGSNYSDAAVSSYLTTPAVSALSTTTNSAWTVDCWVYPTTDISVNGQNLFTIGTGGSAVYGIGWIDSSGEIGFRSGTGSWSTVQSQLTTGANIKAGQWVHIRMVRSSGNLYLFKNGTLLTTATGFNFGSGNSGTFSLFTYFAGYGGGSEKCYMTDFQFSTVARSTTSFSVPTSPATSDANTSLLLSGTNAGIPDSAMMNDLETVGNAQVSTSVKKFGTGSLYFDGSGDYLVTPENPSYNFGTGNFTLEFWVYRAGNGSTSTNRVMQTANGDVITGISLNESSGSLLLFMSSNGSSWNIFSSATLGSLSTSWNHVALVRNGTSIVAYFNGVSAASTTTSAAVYYNNTTPVIGGQTSDRYFNGYIDDLRITKGYARYTANFTPPTAAFPTY